MSAELDRTITAQRGLQTETRWLWLALPALCLVAILSVVLIGRPLDQLTASAPPVEEISVEAVNLTPGLISLAVRADGSAPITIAQVQVDGAYRMFTALPSKTVGRLEAARIEIPYPWIEGEAHHLLIVTASGATFEHSIEVAVTDLTTSAATAVQMILVGLFLGFAPVAAGLLAFPAFSRASPRTMNFLLALTIGLLGYLFVDTLSEGLESAAGALGRLRVESLVWVSAAASVLVLVAIGRRKCRPPEGRALAVFIAFGIGVHNFGEGLAVVGFIIHNVSEGVAISIPLADRQPSFLTFLGLAALAGLPATPGVLLGAAAVSPYLTALCFGVGAGAILQVIIEIGAMLRRRAPTGGPITMANLLGVTLGLAVMYGTAVFV